LHGSSEPALEHARHRRFAPFCGGPDHAVAMIAFLVAYAARASADRWRRLLVGPPKIALGPDSNPTLVHRGKGIIFAFGLALLRRCESQWRYGKSQARST
jgi:hypothetical protein